MKSFHNSQPASNCRLAIGANLFFVVWLATSTFGQDSVPADISQEAIAIADRINADSVHGNLRFLADDLLEGLGPGSKGDLIAQLYLESQFKRMGLATLPLMKSYRQPFPMLGLTSGPAKTWSIGSDGSGDSPVEFQFFKDYTRGGWQAKSKNRYQQCGNYLCWLRHSSP